MNYYNKSYGVRTARFERLQNVHVIQWVARPEELFPFFGTESLTFSGSEMAGYFFLFFYFFILFSYFIIYFVFLFKFIDLLISTNISWGWEVPVM